MYVYIAVYPYNMTYTPNDSSRLISFTAPANDGTLSPKTLDPLPKSLHAILSQRV